ncbi:unnamed protein product [Caenorhabditis brenneri]
MRYTTGFTIESDVYSADLRRREIAARIISNKSNLEMVVFHDWASRRDQLNGWMDGWKAHQVAYGRSGLSESEYFSIFNAFDFDYQSENSPDNCREIALKIIKNKSNLEMMVYNDWASGRDQLGGWKAHQVAYGLVGLKPSEYLSIFNAFDFDSQLKEPLKQPRNLRSLQEDLIPLLLEQKELLINSQ